MSYEQRISSSGSIVSSLVDPAMIERVAQVGWLQWFGYTRGSFSTSTNYTNLVETFWGLGCLEA